MPRYSLIIPTRERPSLFARTIESIWTHTTHKNEIEILIICDKDDTFSQNYVKNAKSKYHQLNMNMITRERSEFSNRDYYGMAALQSTGELIWMFADDLEIVKFDWDSSVWAAYAGFQQGRPDNCFCFSLKDNTPPPSHRLPKFPCFPMFTRECQTLFGWCLHPDPPNWGTDYIAYLMYKPLDRLIELMDHNYINHISHHTHQVESDATSMRIGRIFNKLKMIAQYNTDVIIGTQVPQLRQKLANHIEFCKLGNPNQRKPNYGN